MAQVKRCLLRRWVDDDGAELIEFAIIFPILLLLAAGIADFGFLFQRYEVVTNAAREGARLAVLQGYSQTDVQERVADYLASGGLSDTPNVSVVWAPDTLTSGRVVNTATVIVEYPHQFSILGPVAAMVGGSGWGTLTLRAGSVMRVEGAGAVPGP